MQPTRQPAVRYCAFLLAACCTAAGAQTPKEEDGVVVSATRVAQPSLEIPASIDRLYVEDLRDGRPQANLSESMGRVPGIFVQNRQNYAQDLQISSRGFGARSTFGVRGIRLIADGIPATMPDGQGQAATLSLGSAERIEVLRGPFSSMYGNAAGGVINVQTEDGPAVPQLDAGLYLGSYGFERGAIKFGGQAGRVNYLLDASRLKSEGYRDHSEVKRDHFNGKFKFALSESSGLTLLVNNLRQPQTQDPLGLTRAQVDADPRQATATAITFNTRKTIIQDQIGATFSHAFSGGGRLQATLFGGQRWVEQYLAIPLATQAAATHSGGVVNLDREYGGGALRYSVESTLAGQPLTVSVGAERERMAERRRGFTNVLGVSGSMKRDEDDEVTSSGVYAQGEWKFAERWSAHAGVRATRVEFRASDFFVLPGTANGDDSGSRNYSATTPVAGLVYRVTPRISLYGNLGEGFETPTFAELANRNGASGFNFGLQPGRSRHLEAGAKAVLPGTARASLAVFDILTRDEIVTDQSAGGRSTFKNAGRTSRTGLEISAETLFGGPFEALAAYTFLDATFRDSFTTVTGTPAAPVTVTGGSVLPGTARNQLYAEARWKHAPSGFNASVEGLYRSRVAVNDQNSEFAGSYAVVNLVGGFTQAGAQWKLTEFLRIDNVGDRNYIGSVIVNDANGRFYEPAPRRSTMLGLQASLQF